MSTRQSKTGAILKTIVSRGEKGEDLYGLLTRLAKEHNITSGCFQAIGAVEKAHLGVFVGGEYKWLDHEGEMEIASCLGNIAIKEGEPFVHAHAVMADHKGNIIAGHVGEGCIINPTVEIHLNVYDTQVNRMHDKASGLWLLDL